MNKVSFSIISNLGVTHACTIVGEKKHLSSVLVSNECPFSFVLFYLFQGVSEPLHCCLEKQGIRTVFKSEDLLRPKIAVDPAEQGGVLYRIQGRIQDLFRRGAPPRNGVTDR